MYLIYIQINTAIVFSFFSKASWSTAQICFPPNKHRKCCRTVFGDKAVEVPGIKIPQLTFAKLFVHNHRQNFYSTFAGQPFFPTSSFHTVML